VEIDANEETILERIVKLGYVDAQPNLGFRYRLQIQLISRFTKRDTSAKPGILKPVLVFGLASLVVAAVISYGLWLPTSIDFMAMF